MSELDEKSPFMAVNPTNDGLWQVEAEERREEAAAARPPPAPATTTTEASLPPPMPTLEEDVAPEGTLESVHREQHRLSAQTQVGMSG